MPMIHRENILMEVLYTDQSDSIVVDDDKTASFPRKEKWDIFEEWDDLLNVENNNFTFEPVINDENLHEKMFS